MKKGILIVAAIFFASLSLTSCDKKETEEVITEKSLKASELNSDVNSDQVIEGDAKKLAEISCKIQEITKLMENGDDTYKDELVSLQDAERIHREELEKKYTAEELSEINELADKLSVEFCN